MIFFFFFLSRSLLRAEGHRGKEKKKAEGVFATNRQSYLHDVNRCLTMSLLQRVERVGRQAEQDVV